MLVTGAPLSWAPASPEAWVQDERPALPPAWQPDGIRRGLREPDGLRRATQARACWLHAIQEPACWLHAIPDGTHYGARDATRNALPEQDGFPRASQASFPEQDEIRVWEPDAIQDARPERGFRGEPQEHGSLAAPRVSVFQDELPAFWFQVLHGIRAEQQEREFQAELRAFWFQVSCGFPVVPRVLALRGALRGCGPRGEPPKRCAPGLAAGPRPAYADGRRWPSRKQSCRRGPARCAGFELTLERYGAGFRRRVPEQSAGAECRPGRRCRPRAACSQLCSRARWSR